MLADAGELGIELLAENVEVHFAAGAGEFVFGDQAAFFGGELEGAPIGIGFGEFEVII